MLLTFSKESFVQQIIEGRKIHTIREDKHERWKVGMKIHFWKGNPRNIKSNPYSFAEGVVTKIVSIKIDHRQLPPVIFVNGGALVPEEKELLARRDGFSGLKSFFTWFNSDFKGKIIYWEIQKNLIKNHV